MLVTTLSRNSGLSARNVSFGADCIGQGQRTWMFTGIDRDVRFSPLYISASFNNYITAIIELADQGTRKRLNFIEDSSAVYVAFPQAK